MTENENISISLGDGCEFKVIFAGTFNDDSGQAVAFNDSIKIINGNRSVKLSAIALARLYQALKEPSINKVLSDRLSNEMYELSQIQGF